VRPGYFAVRRLLAALAILFSATAAPAHAQPMPSLDVLVRQFEAVTFESEFGGAHRAGRLIKWQGPVVIRLRGLTTEQIRREVERHVAELRYLSGLPIEVLAEHDGRPANVTIDFSNSRGATRFEPGAPCRAVIYDRGFVITRAEIFIAPAPADLRRHCIAEEITQSLGLANDSRVIRDSIFNDSSRRPSLAPWDALMVRMLYDPRLEPGAGKAAVMPLVREMLALMLIGQRSPAGFLR
jgi:hypothetical protein